MNFQARYTVLTAARVRRMIASREQEGLHLDFKTVSAADLSQKEDRRNFARAVSGFANSDGGLLVWGVEARKNVDGVDCAVAERSFADGRLLVGRLNELTGDATSPVVDGVEHRLLRSPKGDFVVTLVPSSDRPPHMALLGVHEYYKRSGSSFYPMEHFDIADMFGRRASPRLLLNLRAHGGGSSGDGRGGTEHFGTVTIELHNDGRASARAPYVEFQLSGDYRVSRYGVDGNGHEGLPRIVGVGGAFPNKYGATGEYVVHPGASLAITGIDVSVGIGADGVGLIPEDLSVRYSVASDGMPLTPGTAALTGAELLAAVAPGARMPSAAG